MMRKTLFKLSGFLFAFTLLISSNIANAESTSLTNKIQEQLTSLTGCTPTPQLICHYTTNKSTEFALYLKHCRALNHWNVQYTPSASEQIILSADPNKNYACIVTIQYTDTVAHPTPKICPLTQTDLNVMTNLAALQVLQNFDANQGDITPDQMRSVFKPIDDCVKSDIAPQFR